MFEYKLLTANKPEELEGYINQWCRTEGWHVKEPVRPPLVVDKKSPASKWYATLERELLLLEWNKPIESSDLAGFKLYWSITPKDGVNRKWTVLAMVRKEVLSYAIPLGMYAKPGVEYSFSVSAFDIAGNESKQSIIATLQR